MTSSRAIGTVAASALMFAVLGGGIGCGLGVLAPNDYRGLFEGSGPYDDPSGPAHVIDPVQMGLGLGVTQGLGGGIVVGLIVVFLLARGPGFERRQAGPE